MKELRLFARPLRGQPKTQAFKTSSDEAVRLLYQLVSRLANPNMT